jgi:hypothetical protein
MSDVITIDDERVKDHPELGGAVSRPTACGMRGYERKGRAGRDARRRSLRA